VVEPADDRVSTYRLEPLVRPLGMIVVLDEFLDELVKMPVVERDDMAQRLST